MRPIAVVTGAGRGLGRLISERLAGKQFTVLCTDVDGAAAEDTARQIGGGAWAMAHDVRDRAAHERVAAAAKTRGEVRVWVNNAGVMSVGASWEQSESDVRRLIDVNILGVIWGAQAAIVAMRDGGGVLVNVASISALVPTPGLAVYGATKQAVLGFSVSLQGDLDQAGVPIKVAAVCPDAMETDMVKDVAGQEGSNILFSAGKTLLRPEQVADRVAALVARPRLVTVIPKTRAMLVHALRAFPGLELKVLARMSALGRKARLARADKRS